MKSNERLKKWKEKCKGIYNKNVPLRIEWIIAILIAVVMLLMFNYIDLKSLTIWSTNIWDTIADGDITQYYEYTGRNIYNVPHQYNGGPIFNVIFWAVWNLPIWLVQRFMGKVIVKNFILLLWSKLFLVVALGVTLLFAYKICKLLFKDNKKAIWTVYLGATCLFTYLGVFYAGQTDILVCMFATLGIYFLIKEKNAWFYIFSAIAISIKYFFLLPYIPIILLLEKNIWKIIAKIGIGISPIVLFELLAKNLPMYVISEQSNNANHILNGFFGGIKWGNACTISLFILGYIVICFIAYIIKPKEEEEKYNYVVYFSVVPIMIMVMFSTYCEFYRPILLMPMLMILYGFKPELFRINVILETLMYIAFLVSNATNGYLLSSKFSMNGSMITKLLGIKQVNVINPEIFFTELLGDKLQMFKDIGATIVFAMLAIMIVINYPKLNIKRQERENPEKLERWVIWLRTLIITPALAYLLTHI